MTSWNAQTPALFSTFDERFQVLLNNDAFLAGTVAGLNASLGNAVTAAQLSALAARVTQLEATNLSLASRITALEQQGGGGGNSSAITVDFAVAGNFNGMTYTASASSTGGGIVAYEWSLGDGGTASGAVVENRVYAAAGTYTVTLLVRDSTGASKSVSKSVFVSPPAQLFLMNMDGSSPLYPLVYQNTPAWSEETGGENPVNGAPIYVQHPAVNSPLLLRASTPLGSTPTVQATLRLNVSLNRSINGQYEDEYFGHLGAPSFKVSKKTLNGSTWRELDSRVHPTTTLQPSSYELVIPLPDFEGLLELKVEGGPAWGVGVVTGAVVELQSSATPLPAFAAYAVTPIAQSGPLAIISPVVYPMTAWMQRSESNQVSSRNLVFGIPVPTRTPNLSAALLELTLTVPQSSSGRSVRVTCGGRDTYLSQGVQNLDPVVRTIPIQTAWINNGWLFVTIQPFDNTPLEDGQIYDHTITVTGVRVIVP